jgi:hypothetical protein
MPFPLGARGRWVIGSSLAQLSVSRDQSEINRCLEIVKLKLHPPESRADIGGNLVPKVPDAEHAAHKHAQKSTHKENQHWHRNSPIQDRAAVDT